MVPDSGGAALLVSGRLWAVLAGQLINAPAVGCNDSLPSGNRATALTCSVHVSDSLADLVKEIKLASPVWIKSRDIQLGSFQWQAGYGAFSISPSHRDQLIEYIKNQDEHHRHVTFQDEYRKLCAKYGAAIDERYVWD